MKKKLQYKGSVLQNIEDLSTLLSINIHEIISIQENSQDFYKEKIITNSSGKERTVFSVHPKLRNIQETINKEIFFNIEYPDYLQGGIKDVYSPRSYINNAKMHTNQNMLITTDIKSFFPSVKSDIIFPIWFHFFQFQKEISEILTSLTTYNGFLPQGAKTSSYISNLVFWDSEPNLVGNLSKMGYVYSRYIDDISISTKKNPSKTEIKQILHMIQNMLEKKSLLISEEKTKIQYSYQKMTVTGLNVNTKKPTLPRKEQDKIRAAVKKCEELYSNNKTTRQYCRLYNETKGRVEMLRIISPHKGDLLLERLKIVCPEMI